MNQDPYDPELVLRLDREIELRQMVIQRVSSVRNGVPLAPVRELRLLQDRLKAELEKEGSPYRARSGEPPTG